MPHYDITLQLGIPCNVITHCDFNLCHQTKSNVHYMNSTKRERNHYHRYGYETPIQNRPKYSRSTAIRNVIVSVAYKSYMLECRMFTSPIRPTPKTSKRSNVCRFLNLLPILNDNTLLS